MIILPKYSVADVVSQVKAQPASNLIEKFPWLSQVYWKENIVWSPGYFVSTVGIDDEDNHQICTISTKPGFRSNDACIVLKVPRACPWVSTIAFFYICIVKLCKTQ
jgi:putative transposase